MELILAALCLLTGLAILLLCLLLFITVLRQRPIPAVEIAQADASAQKFLGQAALRDWNASALTDLACRWEGAKTGLTRGEYQGRVMSVSQPDSAWLAFYLTLKADQGLMRLRSAAQEMRIEFRGGIARIDALGSRRENDGHLFDAKQQYIGRYKRFQGWRWTMGNRSLTPHYGAIEMSGRVIAEMNDALNWGGGLFDAGDAQRPLIRLLAPNLSSVEEQWLIALVGVELFFNARRARASRAAGTPIQN